MLAHEFYGALADGYPVDAALTEARKAIKTEGNDLEWGTPVLYMRTPDGRIFDISGQPAVSKQPAPFAVQEPKKDNRLEQLYTEGLEAYYLGQWEAACQKFQAVVDADPNFKDAASKLDVARRKIAVQTLNKQAQDAENAKDWGTAITVLKQLSAADPAFPEVSIRLGNAERQQQLMELRGEAEELARAEKWDAIPGVLSQMEKIDPRDADLASLQSRATQALAKIRTERELESTYTSALQALDRQDWQQAARHLRRVRQLQAGYRETDQLLAKAEAEIKRRPVREEAKTT